MTTLEPTTSQSRLKTFAAIAAVIALLQAVLAITMILNPNPVLYRLHEGLGFLYPVMAIVTCVPAKIWADLSHKKGLFFHALGMAAGGVIQLLLGLYAGAAEGLTHVHMGLGVLILIGAVALYTLAAKKPIVVTGADPARPQV